jgi:hypothetical protein
MERSLSFERRNEIPVYRTGVAAGAVLETMVGRITAVWESPACIPYAVGVAVPLLGAGLALRGSIVAARTMAKARQMCIL